MHRSSANARVEPVANHTVRLGSMGLAQYASDAYKRGQIILPPDNMRKRADGFYSDPSPVWPDRGEFGPGGRRMSLKREAMSTLPRG